MIEQVNIKVYDQHPPEFGDALDQIASFPSVGHLMHKFAESVSSPWLSADNHGLGLRMTWDDSNPFIGVTTK